MMLLEQYREQAMAAFIADADSDMTDEEKRTYAEIEVCENIDIVLGYYTLPQLMAYVVTGKITHRYDGGCPYAGEVNERAPWCNTPCTCVLIPAARVTRRNGTKNDGLILLMLPQSKSRRRWAQARRNLYGACVSLMVSPFALTSAHT